MKDAARQYIEAGMRALPADRETKRPIRAIGKWKKYRDRAPTDTELSAWFANGPDAVCILCGGASGNIEIIDFDAGGELFDAWRDRIPAGLRDKLVVERTPSGGYHVIYRCESPVCGNMKLAQRRIDDDRVVTLIETRGEGGLFLCSPTEGYELAQGALANPPALTEDERDVLLGAAWDLNEYTPPVVDGPSVYTEPRRARVSCSASIGPTCRPGDDFNARGDVAALLAKHGWVRVKGGENEYWRRPGKESGISATLKDGVFYVFSSNAAPFEPNRAYSPFSVYALLEHGGDFEQAAGSLRLSGFGGDCVSHADDDVNVSGIISMTKTYHSKSSDIATGDNVPSEIPDPGPLPAEMLRVPGFVSEVMDHCLATAPYPNPVMAFAGALSLMAFLTGRKVRDGGDNRTNIYLLGLAHSASGKDWPRKINTRVLHHIGMADALGEHFASGEGLQDALNQTPTMLFQTDEIDGMLQSINKSKDARHEAVMGTMLTMYSSSNSVFPMRRKAGKESAGVIDQPCLVIFGTAIPNHYYEALSERMLTNGLFARMIILEAGPREPGQEPSIRDLPPRVLATAQRWADFQPGTGNLEQWHPIPVIVEHTDEAKRLLVENREESEAEYAKAEAKGDSVGTTVWGRVSEQTRKLALLYAVSEGHESPIIGIDAVRWASQFVTHQTRRMLFMAASHVADNPFHAECLKLLEKLRDAPGHELPHSVLLKRMKTDAKTFSVLIETLAQQGDIEVVNVPRSGSAIRTYRLFQGVKPGGETWGETSVGG